MPWAPVRNGGGDMGQDAHQIGQHVEQALTEIGKTGDENMRARVEDLVSTLVEFYGSTLERVMELVHERGDIALTSALGDDPLVGSVLVVHDLHPLSTEQRVRVALDKVRPYLGSHAGDVDLIGVVDDVVQLRLAGSCNGCPSSTVTVKLAIEKAIQDVAPEIVDIQVEGVVDEPELGPSGHKLLPLTSVDAPPPPRIESDWFEVTAATSRDTVTSVRLGDVATLLCNVGDHLYAYRDHCPTCGSVLAAGSLDGTVLTCPNCASHFDVTRAGRGTGKTHLDPLPLLTEAGHIRVALPVEVLS
jgi:Fe-S cluster biogenesis protein NfuA/nitrite reductase/ring-hydroxylating ferredoxin subunit